MYPEDELVPLSALQHLLYCERRAALIYLEGIWDDNPFTVEGSHMHERTHISETESRGNIRIARGLPLRSLRLGVSGKADVVEFHRLNETDDISDEDESLMGGISLEGVNGLWQPFPVEYKSGRLRHEEGYEVQLCAQAQCLEEMLGIAVHSGAIYYGKTGRRMVINLDDELRSRTEQACSRLHELIKNGRTPEAVYSRKCDKCSLIDDCLPKALSRRGKISVYLSKLTSDLEEEENEAPP